MRKLMKCGCVAQGTMKNDKGEDVPVCVTHYGLAEGADQVEEEDKLPDLTDRKAYCSYGKHGETPSKFSLPFFRHCPQSDHDEYYCGCYSWD